MQRFGKIIMLASFAFIMTGVSWVQTYSQIRTNQSIGRAVSPQLIILLSVPGLSFRELSPDKLTVMPTLKSLTKAGEIAALNVRTPERGIEDVYASINAGTPAVAPYEVQGYSDTLKKSADNVGEVLEQYQRFTGSSAPKGSIIVPEIGYLASLNESQTYQAEVGRLGDSLVEHHVETAVFGNRDYKDQTNRHAPLMLMNSEGVVHAGDVSEATLVKDPKSPYGIRSDTQYILQEIREFISSDETESTDETQSADETQSSEETPPTSQDVHARVVLIEYGDWNRLDQERSSYQAEQWNTAQLRQLKAFDDFVKKITALINEQSNAQLWIFSPQPHTQAIRDKLHVTPFIRYVQAAESGLLTSPTTRRTGLISLHDLGPTLLASLSVETSEDWTGLPIHTKYHPRALQWLLQDVEKMRNVYELRTNVVLPFVTYEVLVLLISLLMVLMGWRKGLRWMRVPLYSLLTAPLFILLLGFIPGIESNMQLAVLIFMVLGASLCLALFSSRNGMLLIAMTNTLVLLVDGLLGAKLVKYSIMGYDPMIGARYYGIGNEYMGVLVGSAILAAALFLQRMAISPLMKTRKSEVPDAKEGELRLPPRLVREQIYVSKKWLAVGAAAWFLMITLYLASPDGGTNAGGALTASAAFGAAWLLMFGGNPMRRVNVWRLSLVVGGLLCAGLILLWAMNQWLTGAEPSGQSHIGRAMDLLASGRLDIIAGMVVRKLTMNFNLIGVSSWGKVLLTGIFVMAVLLLRPRGLLRKWQEERSYWMSGYTAILIGSVVALALNDSGIVAAGTMIVFAAAPILLLILDYEPVGKTGRQPSRVL